MYIKNRKTTNSLWIKHLRVLCLFLLLIASSCASNDFSKANLVVEKIEKYRKKHLKLPISLEDLGMNHTSGPVYYDKLNDTHYQLFYEAQGNEFWTFNSIEKKWRSCPQCTSMFEHEE